jgi:hypothetical protein
MHMFSLGSLKVSLSVRMSTSCLLGFVLCSTNVKAQEPNTLISVHLIGLNHKGTPIKSTYDKKYNTYQLINEETREVKSIYQNGVAKLIYLQPGRYCFKSYSFSASQRIGIINPLCFDVLGHGFSNVGTWIIGGKVSRSGWYAKLVDMKDNYAELESILDIEISTPVTVYKPKNNE